MLGQDPIKAGEQLQQFAENLQQKAQRYSALHQRLGSVGVTERSAGGEVTVTVDANGVLTDLELSERTKGMDPAMVSATIMSCLRQAQAKLREQVATSATNPPVTTSSTSTPNASPTRSTRTGTIRPCANCRSVDSKTNRLNGNRNRDGLGHVHSRTKTTIWVAGPSCGVRERTLMADFQVVLEELRSHAKTMESFSQRAGTAADAGSHLAGLDEAYGVLCQPFGSMVREPQNRGAEALAKTQKVTQNLARALDEAANAYERLEEFIVERLNRIGRDVEASGNFVHGGGAR